MIGAIIQARMGASRLPGKVLKKISGEALIQHQIDRIKKSNNLEKIIVATTKHPIDDDIVNFCYDNNIDYFRGSEDDVLSRYYECAKYHGISTIVRLTADCPLIDPTVIDKVINLFFESEVDYSSNTVPPETSLWPDGSDVEVFSFKALKRAYEESTKKEEREHVTFYFWKEKSNDFKTAQLDNNEDWSKYRYTVDYIEDFKVLKLLRKEIVKRKLFGHTSEIIKILNERPDIRNINKDYYFGIGWEK